MGALRTCPHNGKECIRAYCAQWHWGSKICSVKYTANALEYILTCIKIEGEDAQAKNGVSNCLDENVLGKNIDNVPTQNTKITAAVEKIILKALEGLTPDKQDAVLSTLKEAAQTILKASQE